VSGEARERREVILIVDDDPAVRTSLAELLGDYGYDTLTECDGTAALDLLDSLPPSSDLQPSVMLVDVMMPEMDGYTFAFASRCRPVTSSVPVILMSAFNPILPSSLPHYIHAFLPKPFKLDRLVKTVRAAVRARTWSCN
jgi:CheY-like chemotaxis protein